MQNKLDSIVGQIMCEDIGVVDVGIVLGSGLGDFADSIKVKKIINYNDIEGFPCSTVEGHVGRFVFGELNGVNLAIMQGRVHYYEGYSMEDVVLPVRVMAMLGAKAVMLTNAAGGVNRDYSEGTLMAITDHICLAPNPLIGANLESLGVRFPDMTNTYNKELLNIINETAKLNKVALQNGVYMQFPGPSYETPAEINMARIMGADAVGMSTACEAIALNHAGVKVCGISCITNMAAGLNKVPLNHDEVSQTANKVKKDFIKLISSSLPKIKENIL